MHFDRVRRVVVTVALLILCTAMIATAQTTTATGSTTGTVGVTSAGGTGTTDTTAETTTTTTAKPTDPHVDSVSYVTEEMQLPKGAVMHGQVATANGRNGQKALSFDGDTNYIEVDIRKTTSPFTLSMWINWQGDPMTDTVGQRVFTFLQKDTENCLSFTPLLKYSDPEKEINGMVLYATCYKDGWLRSDRYYPSNSTVSDMLSVGTWHHLALTVDGNNVTTYIDGIRWRADTLPFAFEDLKADTLLIGSATNGSCLFKGLMQDVQLYAGALTPQQVGRISQDVDPFDATVSVTPAVYTPAPLPHAIQTVQLYSAVTLIENGSQTNTIQRHAADVFWETPFLNGGQSITGVSTVDNRSKHLMDIRLDSISLPQPGTAEWEYLSGVHIAVSADGNILYSGPYTALTADALKMHFKKMAYGRRQMYTITISRPLTAATAPIAVSVPWNFSCEVQPAADSALPEGKPLTALLILLPLSAGLLGFSLFFAITHRQSPVFTFWNTAVARCNQRLIGPLTQKIKSRVHPSKHSDATEEPTQTAESADETPAETEE